MLTKRHVKEKRKILKNNSRYLDKKKVSVILPKEVAEGLKREAEERNVTASYLYTQIMCDGFSHIKTQSAISSLQGDVETLYLALELLGAKLDEIVKFITIRVPQAEIKDEEQKQAIKLKASSMSRSVSSSAEKAVQDYRLGESNVDPLGVEKVLKALELYTTKENN